MCTPPNTILLNAGGVRITLNERWAPSVNGEGQTIRGGAALHVEAIAPTGIVEAELYVGMAAIAVG